MRRISKLKRIFAAVGLLAIGMLSGLSQLEAQSPTSPTKAAGETTVLRGSPAAKASINPLRIPNPPGVFGGEISLDARNSSPYWQPQVVPPKGAPNILLVLIDDEGFAAPSTFGGVIPTPHLDQIAKAGLRYTQFHTTSLCSPTRAALITGRNHHSVGFGVVGEAATGYPGYNE